MKLLLALTTAAYGTLITVGSLRPEVVRVSCADDGYEVIHLNCPRPFIAHIRGDQHFDGSEAQAYALVDRAYCGIPTMRQIKFRLAHTQKTYDYCIFFYPFRAEEYRKGAKHADV